jgi:hypothetical protein
LEKKGMKVQFFLKRSYSVGMFGPAKQTSHKQSRNLLLVNSDSDIVGAMLEMGRCSQTEKSVKVKTQVARGVFSLDVSMMKI